LLKKASPSLDSVASLLLFAGPQTDIQKYRLQILLSLAFGAMFLSLLPE